MKALVAMTAVVGLMLVGSDSPWFPWPNILGLLPLAMVVAKIKDERRR